MLIEIFGQCPRLEYADVTFINSPNIPRGFPVILPNLASLILRASSQETDHSTFFSSLTLPNLLTLSCMLGSAWNEQIFASFIQRSSCVLNVLFLSCVLLASEMLTNWLRLVGGTLSSLTIHIRPMVSDDLLSLLTPNADTQCLCPKLETIDLFDCVSRTRGVLAAMVRSRLPPIINEQRIQPYGSVTALKTLQCSNVEEDMDELKQLKDKHQLELIIKSIYTPCSSFPFTHCDRHRQYRYTQKH